LNPKTLQLIPVDTGPNDVEIQMLWTTMSR